MAQPTVAVCDTPTEAGAALTASRQLAAAAPPGPGAAAAGRAAWRERRARAEEVAEQAYRRLHGWAVATGQPVAVVWAIAEAVAARRAAAEWIRGGGR